MNALQIALLIGLWLSCGTLACVLKWLWFDIKYRGNGAPWYHCLEGLLFGPCSLVVAIGFWVLRPPYREKL